MKRKNPTLLVLSNPAVIPDEAQARKSWERFHLKSSKQAGILQIPDVPGMPRTVVVLGALEGVEWLESRSNEEYETIEFDHDEHEGPWLVTDAKMIRLWIVAKKDDDLKDIPTNGFLRAIYYFPQKSSGKHAAEPYRHAFGDDDGSKHEDGDESCYPRVTGSGRKRALVDGRYYIDPHGIRS